LMEIMKSWRRGDLYARLWAMLYEAGRIAPAPLEARARMRASFTLGEGGEDNQGVSHPSNEKSRQSLAFSMI
jgi:hypothetical protein